MKEKPSKTRRDIITFSKLSQIAREHRIVRGIKELEQYGAFYADKSTSNGHGVIKRHYIVIRTNVNTFGAFREGFPAFWERKIKNRSVYYEFVENDLSKINP